MLVAQANKNHREGQEEQEVAEEKALTAGPKPGRPRCVCPTGVVQRERRGEASTGGSLQLPAPAAGCPAGGRSDAAAGPSALPRGRAGAAGPSLCRQGPCQRPGAPAAGPGRAAGFNPVRGGLAWRFKGRSGAGKGFQARRRGSGRGRAAGQPRRHPTMPAINIEDLSEKDKLKMEVEQLRKEVKLERQPVSKCSEEIKNYIEERSGEDPLVKGVPEDKNPFKEKGGCVIA